MQPSSLSGDKKMDQGLGAFAKHVRQAQPCSFVDATKLSLFAGGGRADWGALWFCLEFYRSLRNMPPWGIDGDVDVAKRYIKLAIMLAMAGGPSPLVSDHECAPVIFVRATFCVSCPQLCVMPCRAWFCAHGEPQIPESPLTRKRAAPRVPAEPPWW